MDFNVRPVPGAIFSTAPAEWLLNEMDCPQQGSNSKVHIHLLSIPMAQLK